MPHLVIKNRAVFDIEWVVTDEPHRRGLAIVVGHVYRFLRFGYEGRLSIDDMEDLMPDQYVVVMPPIEHAAFKFGRGDDMGVPIACECGSPHIIVKKRAVLPIELCANNNLGVVVDGKTIPVDVVVWAIYDHYLFRIRFPTPLDLESHEVKMVMPPDMYVAYQLGTWAGRASVRVE